MYIYADNAGTTKMSPVAIDAMTKCMNEVFGNPSSLHSTGQRAAEVLQKAREDVAEALGADFNEIYFTSGGSETDNQAILHQAAVRLIIRLFVLLLFLEQRRVRNTSFPQRLNIMPFSILLRS